MVIMVNDKPMPRIWDTSGQCLVASIRRVLARANQLDITDYIILAVICTYKTTQGVRVIKDKEFIDDKVVWQHY